MFLYMMLGGPFKLPPFLWTRVSIYFVRKRAMRNFLDLGLFYETGLRRSDDVSGILPAGTSKDNAGVLQIDLSFSLSRDTNSSFRSYLRSEKPP